MRRAPGRREHLDLVSPGLRRFRVRRDGDDAAPGKEAAIVVRFVEDLLAGRLLLALFAFKDGAREVRVTDDPDAERRLCEPGESVTFRLWDGTVVEG